MAPKRPRSPAAQTATSEQHSIAVRGRQDEVNTRAKKRKLEEIGQRQQHQSLFPDPSPNMPHIMSDQAEIEYISRKPDSAQAHYRKARNGAQDTFESIPEPKSKFSLRNAEIPVTKPVQPEETVAVEGVHGVCAGDTGKVDKRITEHGTFAPLREQDKAYENYRRHQKTFNAGFVQESHGYPTYPIAHPFLEPFAYNSIELLRQDVMEMTTLDYPNMMSVSNDMVRLQILNDDAELSARENHGPVPPNQTGTSILDFSHADQYYSNSAEPYRVFKARCVLALHAMEHCRFVKDGHQRADRLNYCARKSGAIYLDHLQAGKQHLHNLLQDLENGLPDVYPQAKMQKTQKTEVPDNKKEYLIKQERTTKMGKTMPQLRDGYNEGSDRLACAVSMLIALMHGMTGEIALFGPPSDGITTLWDALSGMMPDSKGTRKYENGFEALYAIEIGGQRLFKKAFLDWGPLNEQMRLKNAVVLRTKRDLLCLGDGELGE